MNGHAFSFAGHSLTALPSGALYWADEGLLCVSDLHLGKSDRIARREGRLLPPYETRATLDRLASDITATGPKTVICLGDSFDDLAAAEAMEESARDDLARLMAGRHWVWIEGNHDPGPVDLGGTHRADLTVQDITFRHIADPGKTHEVSGHYHPKARITARGRSLSRRCVLVDGARIILPAYGTYTGGLYCDRPELSALMQDPARAILLPGPDRAPLPIPMPR